MNQVIKLTLQKNWKVISLIALAVLLRVFTIHQRGIWYDDAFSILLAKQPIMQILTGTAADTMPPLYYILLHYWMKISTQIAWIRMLNLLIFMAMLGYVYYWVKQLSSGTAGLLAVFFCSISPFLVYHSQEIRMYVMLAFFQVAYLYYFTRWSSSNVKKFTWLEMVICGAGALYSHNLAIFGLVIPGVVLLIQRNYSVLWRWLKIFIASLILFLPWLVFVPGQIQKIQTAFWTPRPGVLEVVQSIYSLFSFLPQPFPWVMITGVLCFQLLGLVGWEFNKQRQQIAQRALIGLGMVFIPLVLFILSYFMRPVYVARGFILSGIVLYCLAGILSARCWPTVFGKIIIGLMILISSISLPFYYSFSSFPRSPFAQACADVNEQVGEQSEGIAVLHDNKLSSFPCVVYEPGLPQMFLGDETGSHNDTLALASQQAMQLFPEVSIQEALKNKSQVYFFVFTRALDEYAELHTDVYPSLAYLDANFQEIDVTYFNDLAVYQYAK